MSNYSVSDCMTTTFTYGSNATGSDAYYVMQSTLTVHFLTDVNACLAVLVNTSFQGACRLAGSDDHSLAEETFLVRVPESTDQWFSRDVTLYSWRWWTNSSEQRRHHSRSKLHFFFQIETLMFLSFAGRRRRPLGLCSE